MGRWGVALWVVAGLGALGACVSLSGLSGGGPSDSGSDAFEAAGQRAEAGDAGPIDTGPIDAGRWCDQPAQLALKFCADFDDTRVQYGWDELSSSADAGATAVQDNGEWTSAPFSLLVSLTAFAGGEEGAGLEKTIQVASSAIHVAFDVRLEQIDMGNASLTLHSLYLGPIGQGEYFGLHLAQQPTGTFLNEQTFYNLDGGENQNPHQLSRTLPFQQWVRIGIDLVVGDAGRATVSVTFDGSSVLDPTPVAPYGFTHPLTVSLGGNVWGPSGAWHVRYDNYTLDYP